MKTKLFPILFIWLGISLSIFAASDFEQPPFEVRDVAISENFRTIYYSVDRLNQLTSTFTYTVSNASTTVCIDDPTFCVDIASNVVISGGQLIGKGTTTNDNAQAGYIGESTETVNSTSVAFPTTDELGDGASLSLTAGDWELTATMEADSNGATWSQTQIGISVTSGNSATGLTIGSNRLRFSFGSTSTAVLRVPLTIPMYRLTLSATTTVYLKVYSSYSAGSPTYRCRLSARRRR